MGQPAPTGPPQLVLPATERLRLAVSRRVTTDYVFSFWTAFGWTMLTCGIFGYYVVYKLFQRSVEHNARRIEVLDAATTAAWERAVAAGRGHELTPWFQSLGAQLDVLRRLTTEFRDPTIWTVLSIVAGGIAQIVGGTKYTVAGALMGTLHYMAPEQGIGKNIDARSDIYSLGVVLYEMLIGHPPFDADTPLAILMKHMNDPLPIPTESGRTIPEPFERVVLKAPRLRHRASLQPSRLL